MNSWKGCSGSPICEHNRQMNSWQDCDGSVTCMHNRQKAFCKPSGGTKLKDRRLNKYLVAHKTRVVLGDLGHHINVPIDAAVKIFTFTHSRRKQKKTQKTKRQTRLHRFVPAAGVFADIHYTLTPGILLTCSRSARSITP